MLFYTRVSCIYFLYPRVFNINSLFLQSGFTLTHNSKIPLCQKVLLFPLLKGFLFSLAFCLLCRLKFLCDFPFAVNSSLNIENVLVISFLEGYNFNTHTMGYFIAEKMQNLSLISSAAITFSGWSVIISSGKYLGPSGKLFWFRFYNFHALILKSRNGYDLGKFHSVLVGRYYWQYLFFSTRSILFIRQNTGVFKF